MLLFLFAVSLIHFPFFLWILLLFLHFRFSLNLHLLDHLSFANQDWLPNVSLGLLHIFLIGTVELCVQLPLLKGALQDLALLPLFRNVLLLFHPSLDILNDFLLLSSHADSHTIGVSTEHVVIRAHLLTPFSFKLSSVAALTSFEGNQCEDSCVGWKILEWI